MPLRLLILAQTMQGRGTERTVVRLLKHFDRTKIAPELALMAAEGEFLDQIPQDVPLHDLARGSRKTLSASWQVDRLIREIRPDCLLGVHTSPGRLLGWLRLLHPRVPVICYETDPFGLLEGAKGALVVRRLATMVSHRLASRVVAASQFVADDLSSWLRLPPESFTVIPNPCVDDELFAAARENPEQPPYTHEPRRPIVINIGNMYPHKAQDVLLRAFARLVERIPAELVILGEGPRREELEKLAGTLGVADRTWFLGFQSNPFKYLAHSSVFVSTAHSEGFDIAQVEAMACGVPVIVPDAPRFRAVEHGKNGLEIPPDDPELVAQAIERVLTSPELVARLTAAAKLAATELSSERITRRYEEVIESVVRKTPRRPEP